MDSVTDYASQVQINDLSHLQEKLEEYRYSYSTSWAFRGMGNAEWTLQPSLERLNINPFVVETAEQYLLTTFQRRVHHYVSDPPDKDDILEWLALQQHHGAPTRLLDWTKSPYVALFFALDERRDENGNCALWAVDLQWCKEQAIQQIEQRGITGIDREESLAKPDTFRNVFFREPGTALPLVAPLQPFRMNQRLTIQQGLFLCPGDLSRSFESNLLEFQTHDFSNHVRKLVIQNNLRVDI